MMKHKNLYVSPEAVLMSVENDDMLSVSGELYYGESKETTFELEEDEEGNEIWDGIESSTGF
jgi:hypothetical protein